MTLSLYHGSLQWTIQSQKELISCVTHIPTLVLRTWKGAVRSRADGGSTVVRILGADQKVPQ